MSSSMAERGSLLLLIALALGGVAWMPLPGDAASSAARPARPADPELLEGEGPLFLLSGNEKGFIRPCGCSKPALGGVHRRATTIEQFREKVPDLVPLSLGDLIAQGGAQQESKLETFLISMAIMGYRGLALGRGELFLAPDRLREMEGLAGFPFIALNLHQGGGRMFAADLHLEAEGYRVTALLPAETKAPGYEVKPPAEALLAYLEGLPAAARVLVLFSGKEAEAKALAAQVPEPRRSHVVLAFGGAGDQPRPVEGPVRTLSIGSKGRFLALVRPMGARRFVESYRLEEGIALHPDVDMVLGGYRAGLGEQKLVEKAPRFTGEIAYVGDKVCAECHEDICSQLDATPHERAWKTLFEYGDQVDPECVSCHVTGWGDNKGFLGFEATPHLVNVTCESCHGPGQRHVEDDALMPRSKPDRAFCLTCHDADNSPHFDYDVYWPKIAHPK